MDTPDTQKKRADLDEKQARLRQVDAGMAELANRRAALQRQISILKVELALNGLGLLNGTINIFTVTDPASRATSAQWEIGGFLLERIQLSPSIGEAVHYLLSDEAEHLAGTTLTLAEGIAEWRAFTGPEPTPEALAEHQKLLLGWLEDREPAPAGTRPLEGPLADFLGQLFEGEAAPAAAPLPLPLGSAFAAPPARQPAARPRKPRKAPDAPAAPNGPAKPKAPRAKAPKAQGGPKKPRAKKG